MTRHREGVKIRVMQMCDLARLHAINDACTPGVGAVSERALASLVTMSCLTLVAERANQIAGFSLYLTDGVGYASLNYRWIAARNPRFSYCDRIAVAPDARGLGIGEQLYMHAFEHLSKLRNVLFCEVNLAPPNPGSLRFHQRLGFQAVGEDWNDDRSKGVVYLERPLLSAS